MLSRSAQGLYWMGRYLERAEHLCRLLRLQVEALVDRPVPEIYFGWSRIYGSLNRQPPGGALDPDESDDYTLADSYALADDLSFERTNPDSIRSCFALGRENARQMRHCISAEMWTCLNLAWLRIRDLGIRDVWDVSPERFYAETAREIATFAGVAEATMYRGEGWHFMQLGRFGERAQLSVALLLAQFDAARSREEPSDADWENLLHVYQAIEAYGRGHGIEVRPDGVLELLVADPSLPRSLRRSLDSADAELAAISPGPDSPAAAATRRLAGRLCARIRYEWPDREDREELLKQVEEECRRFHDLVAGAYVDYAVEDLPEG